MVVAVPAAALVLGPKLAAELGRGLEVVPVVAMTPVLLVVLLPEAEQVLAMETLALPMVYLVSLASQASVEEA